MEAERHGASMERCEHAGESCLGQGWRLQLKGMASGGFILGIACRGK